MSSRVLVRAAVSLLLSHDQQSLLHEISDKGGSVFKLLPENRQRYRTGAAEIINKKTLSFCHFFMG